jgi:hypothetical protein
MVGGRGLLIAKAMNEVDAGRDREEIGCGLAVLTKCISKCIF